MDVAPVDGDAAGGGVDDEAREVEAAGAASQLLGPIDPSSRARSRATTSRIENGLVT